jgi:AcrR family transcriptional regulator
LPDSKTVTPREDGLKRHILTHVRQRQGQAVRANDLLHLGSRASVDQALSRLTKSGALRRSGRGAYIGTGVTLQAQPQTDADASPSKRSLIIKVASELFAARGYYGVSMRDIAEPSGLHIATLYHYFVDKRGLYDAVVKAAWEEGARLTLRIEDSTLSPRTQLENWIRNVLEFHFRRSTSARIRDREIFFDDEGGSPPPADMLKASAENETAVIKLIKQLDPPILRRMSADRVVEMLFALSYATIKFRPAHNFIRAGEVGLDLETITRDVLTFVGSALGWPDEG